MGRESHIYGIKGAAWTIEGDAPEESDAGRKFVNQSVASRCYCERLWVPLLYHWQNSKPDQCMRNSSLDSYVSDSVERLCRLG
jgi:hypothetical protein